MHYAPVRVDSEYKFAPDHLCINELSAVLETHYDFVDILKIIFCLLVFFFSFWRVTDLLTFILSH